MADDFETHTFIVSDDMLKQARKALSEHVLCDRCLGRMFGKVGHGLTNMERGMEIRKRLAETGSSGTDMQEKCWLCDNIFDGLDEFVDIATQKVEGLEFDTFLVGTRLTPYTTNREEELWASCGVTSGELIKSEFNRELGKLLSQRWGKNVEFGRPDILVLAEPEYGNIEIEINSIFIYGRYRKLIRGIPQTHWPCRYCHGKGCEHCNWTGKMYKTSVEEIIAEKVLEATEGSGEHFHGMGREDIDALMLGSGRPFILEITEPRKRHLDLSSLQREINSYAAGRVEVSSLEYAEKSDVARIKQAAAPKTYRVSVLFEEGVDSESLKKVIEVLGGAVISQRTPKRVAHRRADKVRKRRVLGIRLPDLPDSETVTGAELEIKAESGTYIKELMHGDGGRTVPSLAGLLGVPVRVEALDVIHIHDMEVQ